VQEAGAVLYFVRAMGSRRAWLEAKYHNQHEVHKLDGHLGKGVSELQQRCLFVHCIAYCLHALQRSARLLSAHTAGLL